MTWLEEGRVYRFSSPDDALLALLLYATALGLDHREARELAGLPVPPKPFEANLRARLAVLGAIALAAIALVARSRSRGAPRSASGRRRLRSSPRQSSRSRGRSRSTSATAAATSPTHAASRHGSVRSGTASPASAAPTASTTRRRRSTTSWAARRRRAARPRAPRHSKPLPGGDNPRRLVVVVGPQRGPASSAAGRSRGPQAPRLMCPLRARRAADRRAS